MAWGMPRKCKKLKIIGQIKEEWTEIEKSEDQIIPIVCSEEV